MKPLDIVYRLKKKGLRQRAIADELGVSQGLVSNVIYSRTTCLPVALHIANLLGKDVQAVFPGKYNQARRRAEALRASSKATAEAEETAGM